LPQAGRLRNSNATAFTPLKKASHFFNSSYVGTIVKEVAYVVTGGNAEKRYLWYTILFNFLIPYFLFLISYFPELLKHKKIPVIISPGSITY
jgi:hypothetical protein